MLFNNFCVLVRISKQDQNLFYFFNLQYLFDEFSLQKYIKITIFQFSLVIIPHQIIFLNTLSKSKCNICHFAQNFVQIFSHLFLYSRLESHRDESICYQKYHAFYFPYSILYHIPYWIVICATLLFIFTHLFPYPDCPSIEKVRPFLFRKGLTENDGVRTIC